ncbi:MAG: branched-chain amino acid ABC transporter permease [Chloroflexi bacterium]|nr:branched-chain amino acid ABC transporter permease [Chloroflexota bacterium]
MAGVGAAALAHHPSCRDDFPGSHPHSLGSTHLCVSGVAICRPNAYSTGTSDPRSARFLGSQSLSPVETVIQILLIGLANGSIIALIALGYTLVYGIIELINFAHGDVYMIGTMLALTLLTWVPTMMGVRRVSLLPVPTIILLVIGALLLAMIGCALLNMIVERLAYRPLRRAPRLAPLISAIGVSFILVNVGLLWKGPSPVDFPSPHPILELDLLQLAGLNTLVFFKVKDLGVMLLAIPLMVGLSLFVNRTRLGKAMRATAQDRDAAAMMGININQTIALTFLLGGALAGAAGLINGTYNNTAVYLQGFRGGLMAFTAAVLGGIGNLYGAFLGGLMIGIVAATSDFMFDPRWTQAIVFGMLVLTLVFKPNGLLGESSTERA